MLQISGKMLKGFKMGPILADPTKGSTALANKDIFFLSHISKESSGFGS